MEFLGISFWEFLLIMVVVLVVLGPSRIPGVMRTIGTIIRHIRRISSDLSASIAREMALDETRRATEAKKPSPPEDKIIDADPPKKTTSARTAPRRTKHDEQ